MAKEKKQKLSVNLPSARKQAKRDRQSGRINSDRAAIGTFIYSVVVFLLIAFILLGGTSQTGFLKTTGGWGLTIGEKLEKWVNEDTIVTNDDGIYVDIDGDGNPG